MAKATTKKNQGNAREFGVLSGTSGPHASRTMALEDLTLLLDSTSPDSGIEDYARIVVEENLLDKATDATRKGAMRRLRELYALDPSVPVFRVLRKLWDLDKAGRPLLALLVAVARDPLLRATASPVLKTPIGVELIRQSVSQAIDEFAAGRMNEATIDKVARNASSSWSQAGHLTGRVRKIRHQVEPTPVTVTFAILLGYVNGLRGKKLLASEYIKLLDAPEDVARARAIDARRLGLIQLRETDEAFDVGFSGLLTDREMRIANGTN